VTTLSDALRATDVSLAYGRERIVHAASIALAPGRVTALVGPNGSGKSTLLRGLTALHRPTEGRVAFADGVDAATLRERELARRIALLAQSHPDPSGVSAREVVAYGRFAHRGRFRAADPRGEHAIDRHERAPLRQSHHELPVLGEETDVEPARELVRRPAHQQAARRIHKVGEKQVLEPHVGGAVPRYEAPVTQILPSSHVPREVPGVQHLAVVVDVLGEHESAFGIRPQIEGIDQGR
jgi:ABC-type ATPase involved in cell division